jgi:hypothetical protein
MVRVCFSPGRKRTILSSRREAAADGAERPSFATTSATGAPPPALPTDPQLAELAAVWDRLAQAMRDGIMAMLKAPSID